MSGTATAAQLGVVVAIVRANDDVFIADKTQVRKVTKDGALIGVAGQSPLPMVEGGPAATAVLNSPTGAVLAEEGNRVRQVLGAERISTIFPSENSDTAPDYPASVSTAPGGGVYIADTGGNRVLFECTGGDVVGKVEVVEGQRREEAGYLYDGQIRVVGQVDSTGTLVSRFVYATHVNSPDAMVRGGGTYRFVHDVLGSMRLVVNSSTGEVAQRLNNDAWGNVTKDSHPGFQPFGYAGGLYDVDTGLVRFGVRDYDPSVGARLNEKVYF